ncbi:hypothetical protein P2H44_12960 [Albimonas sp. CAU 1670]|uniref:hypothetical protein n=1 Tax=Albimonas sp. CAU 1670 TaxID=3032599 RepID=UPI0023DC115D|nr:hypothetical protein [Albimonas sp. CAU 1670]MDF2233463.1 hypothetical protein [Albimonas sp. CAU 1670]
MRSSPVVDLAPPPPGGDPPARGADPPEHPAAPRALPRLRRRLRNRLAELDGLYLPLARLARPDHAVGPATELVVEGFPRSANSWIEGCVREAWPGLRVAQHLHAAASLRAAARRGLPAMLLLRAPEAAVASLLLREPAIYDPALGFEEYVRFHAGLAGAVDRLLVVPFEAATGPFPAVARALVARFALDWPVPDWSPAREAGAWAQVDRLTRDRVGRAHVSYSPAQAEAERARRGARAAAAAEVVARAAAADPRVARLQVRARAWHDVLRARAPAGLSAPPPLPGPSAPPPEGAAR